MKSVMTHNFSQVPSVQIPRSQFNRSHGYKTTFDVGQLVPIYVDEALPGDTFNLNLSTFARLATPIAPIMDNLFIDTFFFAVPIRLVWDNFQKFNGEQENPNDSIDYLIPQMNSGDGYEIGSLSDYMGLPTTIANLDHSSFWHRAYNLIYNEWFRDQNLQDSVTVDKGDGPDDPANYTILKRGKRHDYFTSCLPWPQKGPAVDIPLGTSAPIKIDYNLESGARPVYINDQDGDAKALSYDSSTQHVRASENPSVDPLTDSLLIADLTKANAATINSLREAFQIQKLYEKDARGGTRYTEIIRSHFGVVSPDARLQRPEYLGGGSQNIHIQPVAQTSGSGEYSDTPAGSLSAFGTSASNSHGFTKSFTEHTLIIGMANLRADLNYQQGLDRMFSRRERFDFYWPSLAHLGEQAVLNKEIYAQGGDVSGTTQPLQDDEVFGYQERFAEYRYCPSKITGKFRSTATDSLDLWHLAQDFGNLPVLNSEFITEDIPINRVLATPEEPDILFDSFFSIKCARPMPVYSVPGLIDHF